MHIHEIYAAIAAAPAGATTETIFADQLAASRVRTAATAALSPAERESALASATGRAPANRQPSGAVDWAAIHAKIAKELGDAPASSARRRAAARTSGKTGAGDKIDWAARRDGHAPGQTLRLGVGKRPDCRPTTVEDDDARDEPK